MSVSKTALSDRGRVILFLAYF